MCAIFTTPRFPHLYEYPKCTNVTSMLAGERVSQHKMRMKKQSEFNAQKESGRASLETY